MTEQTNTNESQAILNKVEIGRKIRECRQRQCISQVELMHDLGYRDRSTIAKIESGNIDLSTSRLSQIARAFDMPIEYFLGFNERKWHKSVLDDYNSSKTSEEKKQIVQEAGCVDPSISYDYYSNVFDSSVSQPEVTTQHISPDALRGFKSKLATYVSSLTEDQAAQAFQTLQSLFEDSE